MLLNGRRSRCTHRLEGAECIDSWLRCCKRAEAGALATEPAAIGGSKVALRSLKLWLGPLWLLLLLEGLLHWLLLLLEWLRRERLVLLLHLRHLLHLLHGLLLLKAGLHRGVHHLWLGLERHLLLRSLLGSTAEACHGFEGGVLVRRGLGSRVLIIETEKVTELVRLGRWHLRLLRHCCLRLCLWTRLLKYSLEVAKSILLS